MIKTLMSLGLLIIGQSLIASEQTSFYAEYMLCNYNEGKTFNDVIAESRSYGEFSKSKETRYRQGILTPMHSGAELGDYDYILFGSWPSQPDMYREWGSYANDYESWSQNMTDQEAAGTCVENYSFKETNASHQRIPSDQRDLRQPFEFLRCQYREGKSLADFLAAHRKLEAAMKEVGIDGFGVHAIEPDRGQSDTDQTDFIILRHWYSFEKRAQFSAKWSSYAELSDARGIGGELGNVMECGHPKSYVGQIVFDNW